VCSDISRRERGLFDDRGAPFILIEQLLDLRQSNVLGRFFSWYYNYVKSEVSLGTSSGVCKVCPTASPSH
jgi:hypothetical protein